MHIFHTFKTIAVTVPVLAALSSPATAALLTYDFEGVIDVLDEEFIFSGKAVGDVFAGSFTLDTNASVKASSSQEKTYSGDFTFTSDGQETFNDAELRVFEFASGTDFLALYDPLSGVALEFEDSTGTALSGLGVPTSPLMLSDWDNVRIIYSEPILGGFIEEIGTLTSLTLRQSSTPVPVPGALALLGLGLLGLGVRRRAA